jgi:hypothetical protein
MASRLDQQLSFVMPAHATPSRMRCSRCKKVKGKTRFSKDASRTTGYFPWCVDCQNEYGKSHRFQDETAPENGRICPVDDRAVRGPRNRLYCSSRCKEKVQKLKRNFGLTIEQFRTLVDAAGGRCPICLKRPTEWHVDHDHGTGRVMGVVCSACNVGALASTYHDPEFVTRLHGFLVESPASRLGIEALALAVQPSQLHRRWQHGARRPSRGEPLGP